MSIAKTVVDCLQQDRVPYDVLSHPRTTCARETIASAALPADRLAKAVVLSDGRRYVMAVIPANKHISLRSLSRRLKRDLALAQEGALSPVFKDCEPGAIPPLGPAYGLETIVDESLAGQPEVYFEAGDHEELIRVTGEQFVTLLRRAQYERLTH